MFSTRTLVTLGGGFFLFKPVAVVSRLLAPCSSILDSPGGGLFLLWLVVSFLIDSSVADGTENVVGRTEEEEEEEEEEWDVTERCA